MALAAAVEFVTVALALVVVGAVVLVAGGVGGGVVGLARLTTNRNQRPAAAVLHILQRIFTYSKPFEFLTLSNLQFFSGPTRCGKKSLNTSLLKKGQ